MTRAQLPIEDGWRFFGARRAVNLAMKVKQVTSGDGWVTM
jgi:hypothetical protein